jgi:hypothetical protein
LTTLYDSVALVVTAGERIGILMELRGCGEWRGTALLGEGRGALGSDTVRTSLVLDYAFFAEQVYPMLGPKGSSSSLMGGVIPPQRRLSYDLFRVFTGEPGRGVMSPASYVTAPGPSL